MQSVKQTILERLEKIGIKPSKGLGQNFLIDTKAYDKIVEAADLKQGETVLEIGPGLGTLTERLVATGAKVIAVEKDRKLISFLSELLGNTQSSNLAFYNDRIGVRGVAKAVTVIEADALKFNPTELGFKDGQYKVVANIPYYITGQLLKNIYEVWPKPSLVVLLVQKEVAQRMIAKPPHSNILALTTQYFAEPKIISYISKHNFYPSPKVDSAIIRLATSDPPSQSYGRASKRQANKEEAKKLFRVIKLGFSSKRKKLTNNLSAGFGPTLIHKGGTSLSKEQISAILRGANIDENVRPENLTLNQWQELSDSIS